MRYEKRIYYGVGLEVIKDSDVILQVVYGKECSMYKIRNMTSEQVEKKLADYKADRTPIGICKYLRQKGVELNLMEKCIGYIDYNTPFDYRYYKFDNDYLSAKDEAPLDYAHNLILRYNYNNIRDLVPSNEYDKIIEFVIKNPEPDKIKQYVKTIADEHLASIKANERKHSSSIETGERVNQKKGSILQKLKSNINIIKSSAMENQKDMERKNNREVR